MPTETRADDVTAEVDKKLRRKLLSGGITAAKINTLGDHLDDKLKERLLQCDPRHIRRLLHPTIEKLRAAGEPHPHP